MFLYICKSLPEAGYVGISYLYLYRYLCYNELNISEIYVSSGCIYNVIKGNVKLMKKISKVLVNFITMSVILEVCFLACLFIQKVIKTERLIPAVFVLGAFLISGITEGYIYGIVASLISVIAVNFAFTFPYFSINFTITENLVSAVIMIIVSVITCAITTKLKKQEALKAESEKERMRANLLRAVSHDLRTPLTTIYGSSSAMLENGNEFTEEQKKDMLRGIKEDAQWLSRMVENLLSVTKLDNGNVKIIKTPTVLDELIDSVLVKFHIHYPQQEVFVDIPEEFLTIPMDALLIEQVLINLLENAVKHAEDMTKLSLKVFVISDKAIFEIEDNGKGMSEEDIQPGIGISVCNTIIKAHGGDLRPRKAKSGGLIMRFSLDIEGELYE